MKLNEALKFVGGRYGKVMPSYQLILLHMVNEMEETGEDYIQMSALHMSKKCICTPRTFQRAILALKNRGIVSVEPTKKSRGFHGPNIYRVIEYKKREECKDKPLDICL